MRDPLVLAPDFIQEHFAAGTKASVWFRNNSAKGGMPGTVQGWAEHKEEMASYVWFRTLDGDELCLPYGNIYLAQMREHNFEEAKMDFELTRRAKKVNRKQLEAQLEAAESGGGRVQPAPMMPPGGGRFA